MLEIRNTEVFGLERAVKASGNAMTTGEINTQHFYTQELQGDESVIVDPNWQKDLDRGQRLGKAPIGSAHDHFLVGIHVQFDIKYPQYWTIEAERYHNFEIITSQSKMHKLTTMASSPEFKTMFNKYVDQDIIKRVEDHVFRYGELQKAKADELGGYLVSWDYYNDSKDLEEEKYEYFMKALSNLPMGFEMWMTCDLTYLQLKTMYFQRKNHKLKEDWGAFCKWCEELPMFRELTGITG